MRALLCVHQACSWAPRRCLASSSPDNAGLSPAAPVEGASCPQQGWSLGAMGPVPGLLRRPELLAELSCSMTDVPAAAGSPG